MKNWTIRLVDASAIVNLNVGLVANAQTTIKNINFEGQFAYSKDGLLFFIFNQIYKKVPNFGKWLNFPTSRCSKVL